MSANKISLVLNNLPIKVNNKSSPQYSLPKVTKNSPIQNGVENLNKISGDFANLDSSIENLQKLFDKYQLVLDELLAQRIIFTSYF